MWHFANSAMMTKQDLKKIDVFALGLIWAEILGNHNVIESLDGDDPQLLRLLEILKKVDQPQEGEWEELKELGYFDQMLKFAKAVATDDKKEVEKLLSGYDADGGKWRPNNPPGNISQRDALNMPYMGITEWVRQRSRSLARTSRGPELIRQATRFAYTNRPTIEQLLRDEYFADLCDERTFLLPWEGSLESPYFEDVAADLASIVRIQERARRNKAMPGTNDKEEATKSINKVHAMVRSQIRHVKRPKPKTPAKSPKK